MKKRILDDNVDMLKSILSLQQEALKETRLVLERGVYFYVFMISLISAYISKEIENLSREVLTVIFCLLLSPQHLYSFQFCSYASDYIKVY
ncbi:hypothetical protein [Porphyromonas gulae]|uniref:hypothetical protein n=1 Tax=Porphyromonas gulae TaxID=111105 RepID=UPI0012D341D1|nr:hypothetical protein [Porphyromonas gulae]